MPRRRGDHERTIFGSPPLPPPKKNGRAKKRPNFDTISDNSNALEIDEGYVLAAYAPMGRGPPKSFNRDNLNFGLKSSV